MSDKAFTIIDTPPANPEDVNYRFNHDRHLRRPFTIVDEVGNHHGYGFAKRIDAETYKARLEWEHALPLGQRTSNWLVDVRAVHSKARTTLGYMGRNTLDAEGQEIHRDLAKVVELLDRWQRTGRPPKYPDQQRG